ncbi:hypothetical protein BJI67_05980 [Acidihalobacter aeolianus]|uniref:Phospholipase D-like domain-containing protein n=1 Tax=Acidihalobacter aeolianus TaxID=2792603 RepID=A0A1D8K6T0_9GAMM|nr:phospholipase D-like domain-containing protein [Acidihalobacter aeolianus]AOV16672.1 hypothetical protein BJI67_05980 [Acidihalobacter aeolianus]
MLYTEPHSGPTPIVQVIRAARRQVAIDAYELDDTAVIDAIAAAVHHGVTVQVILAPRPKGRPVGWAREEFHRLAVTGAEVRWSPYRFSHRYAIDHAHIVVDDQGRGPCLVDSENLTWRAIFHARGNLWISHDPVVNNALAQVFDADWLRQHVGRDPRRILLVSPSKSRPLAHLLLQSGPVDLEARKFGYLPRIIHALERKGREARVILPATLSRYDHANLKGVLGAGVQVRYLRGLNIQGTMIAGPTQGFVGSQNLSWSVLHSSRDVGIVLRGHSVGALRAAFDRDWRRASPVA